jgi:hypothetical protein
MKKRNAEAWVNENEPEILDPNYKPTKYYRMRNDENGKQIYR